MTVPVTRRHFAGISASAVLGGLAAVAAPAAGAAGAAPAAAGRWALDEALRRSVARGELVDGLMLMDRRGRPATTPCTLRAGGRTLRGFSSSADPAADGALFAGVDPARRGAAVVRPHWNGETVIAWRRAQPAPEQRLDLRADGGGLAELRLYGDGPTHPGASAGEARPLGRARGGALATRLPAGVALLKLHLTNEPSTDLIVLELRAR